MKIRTMLYLIICLVLLSGISSAKICTYRQIKDVVATEKGKVKQSEDKSNLFEYTYDIDKENKIVRRIKVRRLDENTARDDNTIYRITEEKELLGSEAGNGGKVIVAVRNDGGEILQLGHRFALSTRTSPFSQVITGTYKKVYKHKNKEHFFKKLP